MTSNVEFHLRDEMIAYCQSNVRLFKVGCQKFMAEFRLKAGFDPIEKSISAACHLYWRKLHPICKTFVVQPPRGWNGAQVSQSKVALDWLA